MINNNLNINNTNSKLTDSNKENWTPSSYSTRQSINNFQENNLKLLREKKDAVISTMEENAPVHFKLLKEKEDLSYQVLQKDCQLFKEKTDLEYLNNLLREKEIKMNNALQSSVNCDHSWMENEFISHNIFQFTLDGGNSNKVSLKLKNDIIMTGVKERENATLTGIYKNEHGNTGANDIYDKSFNSDPKCMKYFAAFNIN